MENSRFKFRAWDKMGKIVVKVNMIDFLHNVSLLQYSGKYPRGLNNIELLQYTGLKDKNGVEIYEGDILANLIDEENEVFGAVSYNCVPTCIFAGMYILTDIDGFSTDYAFEDNGKPEEWHWLEIIGNIYENPELLND